MLKMKAATSIAHIGFFTLNHKTTPIKAIDNGSIHIPSYIQKESIINAIPPVAPMLCKYRIVLRLKSAKTPTENKKTSPANKTHLKRSSKQNVVDEIDIPHIKNLNLLLTL